MAILNAVVQGCESKFPTYMRAFKACGGVGHTGDCFGHQATVDGFIQCIQKGREELEKERQPRRECVEWGEHGVCLVSRVRQAATGTIGNRSE